ncbi:hypothetical protein LTR37_002911 [Vermiconidia calcicola]|uniref:Uncharacterized protein n=1 Tax=Vermiconidia calcicola TaxID=1690605 RepID=A0ACC3NSB0_9PEZI|nr:hypothetical protein LTR37_002911 [Vermiconidia calcicola]
MPAIPPYFQQEMPAISRPEQAPATATTAPIQRHKFPTPRLRLHLNDIGHEGSSIFLSNVKGNEDLEHQGWAFSEARTQVKEAYAAAEDSRKYTTPIKLTDTFTRAPESSAECFESSLQPILPEAWHTISDNRFAMYTSGTDLDHDHKEIHINLHYIKRTSSKASPRDEILGVICHELVHCFQWAASGTCPGGLVEGVADWVRLRAGLAAKHWKQEAGGKWDGGYQHTGYFLEYLEQRFGAGTVRKLNDCLRDGEYNEEKLFGDCCKDHRVEDLWKDYADDLKKKQGKDETRNGDENGEEVPNPIPTHGVQA